MRAYAMAALAAAGAVSAYAHVILAPDTVQSGKPTVIALRVGHGCSGAATTRLRVELPEAVASARPEAKPGWTIAVERTGGDKGRPTAVTWTGGPLADELYDDFHLLVTVKGAEGKLALPTVQTCDKGESRWVETAVDPKAPHDKARPAPVLTVAPADPLARLGPISVTAGWVRLAPPGAPAMAAYLTIRNEGAKADRLTAVKSEAAEKTELHTMSMTGGVMRMRPLVGGLAVPGHGDAALKPGGEHIMLIGPKRPLAEGEKVRLTLVFEHAGAVPVELSVRPAGDGDTDHDHMGHDHADHGGGQ